MRVGYLQVLKISFKDQSMCKHWLMENKANRLSLVIY